MASEQIVSPGVFINEFDLSFLPQAIGEIGAAVVGPTVKGPALVPTYVSSYVEYKDIFGDTFKSGSQYYQYLTSHAAEQYFKNGNKLLVTRILAGIFSPAISQIPKSGSSWSLAESQSINRSFTLTTLSDGLSANSSGSYGSNNLLTNGTVDNVQWQISGVNETKGTFNLLIRRGNDNVKRKIILESWNNLNLDPNSSNYIEKRLGDQTLTLRDSGLTTPFLQPSGSYPIKSKYVRVTVSNTTVDYLDENGSIRVDSASGSLPAISSGSFSGGLDGHVNHPRKFYDNINNTNSQGFVLNVAESGSTSYIDALKLLSNQDEYDFNILTIPGVISNLSNHSAVATKAIDICETRGDAFTVIDPVAYGSTISDVTTQADARDSSYAAVYWPWVEMPDNQLGKNVWVPPSVVMPSIYAFNDLVAAEWFAPAGFNRGGIDTAVQAERKLTKANRDTLYDSNVNPIATFPNAGLVTWGQKTLQKKESALDRINVRRLLITSKKFIASTSRMLVFEQNTAQTRKRFLNIANPYFDSIQSKQGLHAFKLVMDSSNNTSDVIDRNQLKGAIYLQPTRTSEFIIIDFNVLPTGAVFPNDEN